MQPTMTSLKVSCQKAAKIAKTEVFRPLLPQIHDDDLCVPHVISDSSRSIQQRKFPLLLHRFHIPELFRNFPDYFARSSFFPNNSAQHVYAQETYT